jgi:anti-anti-sigma factor
MNESELRVRPTVQIGPVMVRVDPEAVRFHFVDTEAILLEVPPGLEAELREFARSRRGDVQGKAVRFDLQDVGFVSSRQLGVLLTIRKVLAPGGQVRLENVSPVVRNLLEVARLTRHFSAGD